jgi:hypothetical protein
MSLAVFNPYTVPSTSSPFFIVSSLLMRDSFNVVWALTVSTSGNLVTTVSSGAAIPFFTLQDSSGVYWKVSLFGSSGNLQTAVISTPAVFIADLFITDSSGRNWFVSVLNSGNLETQ